MARALTLPEPPEPSTLRGELRVAVGDVPETASGVVAEALARHLRRSWDETLVPPDLLASVVEGCRYEALLWVMGDRSWSQLADTLSGRVVRRSARCLVRPVPSPGTGTANS